MRWTDGLNDYFNIAMGLAKNDSTGKVLWMALAEDREGWQALEGEYIKSVL